MFLRTNKVFSIFKATSWFIISLAVCFMALAAFLSYFLLSWVNPSSLHDPTITASEIFVTHLREDFVFGRYTDIKKKCYLLKKTDNIKYIHIKNSSDKTICHHGHLKTDLHQVDQVLYFDQQQNTPLAYITIGFERILSKSKKFKLLVLATLFVVITIAISILFYLFQKKHVITPLARITHQIKQGLFTGDQQSQRTIAEPSILEIQVMHSALSQMSENIEVQQKKLLQYQELETKSQIYSWVLHNLGTPLISLQWLAKKIVSDLDTENKELLDTIIGQVNYVYAKMDQSNYNQQTRDTCNLYETITSFIDQAKLNPDLSICFDSQTDHTVEIHANKSQIHDILGNLLRNSIDAKASTRKLEVKVKLYTQTRSLVLEFSDNGKGIHPDLVPYIFDHGFTHDKVHGKGIGLSSVKQSIQSISGNISVTSKYDLGTTFYIELSPI